MPSATLSTAVVDTFDGYPPEQLSDIADNAEALAEHRVRESRLEKESESEKQPTIGSGSRSRTRSATVTAIGTLGQTYNFSHSNEWDK